MSDINTMRDAYEHWMAVGASDEIQAEARGEFDAILAAHDAAIAHAAWSEGHTQALVNVAWPDERKSNPYTNNESEGHEHRPGYPCGACGYVRPREFWRAAGDKRLTLAEEIASTKESEGKA